MSNPLTPPPELVQQWHKEACKDPYHGGTFFESKTLKHIAAQAAQWGAEAELEACCAWLKEWQEDKHAGGIENLRAARRPKPPSLKEQALAALEVIPKLVGFENERDAIRRALETIDD